MRMSQFFLPVKSINFGRDKSNSYMPESSELYGADKSGDSGIEQSLEALKKDNFSITSQIEQERKAKEAAEKKAELDQNYQILTTEILPKEFGNGVTVKSVLKAAVLLLQQKREHIEALEAKNLAAERHNNEKKLGFIPRIIRKQKVWVPNEEVTTDEIKKSVFHPNQYRDVDVAISEISAAGVLRKRFGKLQFNESDYPESLILKALKTNQT